MYDVLQYGLAVMICCPFVLLLPIGDTNIKEAVRDFLEDARSRGRLTEEILAILILLVFVLGGPVMLLRAGLEKVSGLFLNKI